MEYDEGCYSINGYPLRDGLRAAMAEGCGKKVRRCLREFGVLSWHSCQCNIGGVRRPTNMVGSFLSFPKNQGEKSMTEERDCIFCWESDEPETL
jgi:hypothetical protein